MKLSLGSTIVKLLNYSKSYCQWKYFFPLLTKTAHNFCLAIPKEIFLMLSGPEPESRIEALNLLHSLPFLIIWRRKTAILFSLGIPVQIFVSKQCLNAAQAYHKALKCLLTTAIHVYSYLLQFWFLSDLWAWCQNTYIVIPNSTLLVWGNSLLAVLAYFHLFPIYNR